MTTSPTFETIRYGVADGIATVGLHRPEKVNAFNFQMADELISAFDATDVDDAVRAVIVTGAGKVLCAGADLSSGGATFDYERRYGTEAGAVRRDNGGRVTTRIFRSLKPVIGAINGAAVGGRTMQLPMDIRIASTEARFGLVFARRGIGGLTGEVSRLLNSATELAIRDGREMIDVCHIEHARSCML